MIITSRERLKNQQKDRIKLEKNKIVNYETILNHKLKLRETNIQKTIELVDRIIIEVDK